MICDWWTFSSHFLFLFSVVHPLTHQFNQITILLCFLSPTVQSCNVRCMNGGSCAEDTCTCPKGYTGNHCGQRECTVRSPGCECVQHAAVVEVNHMFLQRQKAMGMLQRFYMLHVFVCEAILEHLSMRNCSGLLKPFQTAGKFCYHPWKSSCISNTNIVYSTPTDTT